MVSWTVTQDHLNLNRCQQGAWMMLANPSNGFSPRDTHHLHGQKHGKECGASDSCRAVDQCTLRSSGILNRLRDGHFEWPCDGIP